MFMSIRLVIQNAGQSIFLLITLRPPCPTLFPYTTLFRSAGQPAPDQRAVRRQPQQCAGAGDRGADPDRKSTRLNSSHPSTSYAVFGLIKNILTHLLFRFGYMI